MHSPRQEGGEGVIERVKNSNFKSATEQLRPWIEGLERLKEMIFEPRRCASIPEAKNSQKHNSNAYLVTGTDK